MAGATLVSTWLAYAALLVSVVRAGWELPSPDHAPENIARRQAPSDPGTITTYVKSEARKQERYMKVRLTIHHRRTATTLATPDTSTQNVQPLPSPAGCSGLAALGGDRATYVTSNGVAYQLYCGIVPLPIFYDARAGDADIVNCLSDCDLDPDCGASYLINEICYYSENPESYEQSDDPEAVLALRAASPDPYPDLSSSSGSDSSTTSFSSSSVEVPPIYPDVAT